MSTNELLTGLFGGMGNEGGKKIAAYWLLLMVLIKQWLVYSPAWFFSQICGGKK